MTPSDSKEKDRETPDSPPVDGPSPGPAGEDKEETGASSGDKPAKEPGSDQRQADK